MQLRRVATLTAALMLALDPVSALAQSAPTRFEAGGGATVLRLSRNDATTVGISGRFTVDISRWLAVEAETTFFPNDDIFIREQLPSVDLTLGHLRRRTDGFFGVKFGTRASQYGVFGKVRPGFTHLTDQGVTCMGADCARILLPARLDRYRTEFALDVGAGFEFFPSRRTVARVDVGDTIIQHRSDAPPCRTDPCTSHNLTTRIGGAVRF